MMRSLYSGVSGMRAQQTLMDVIGNNIANVGTVGYKATRVTFEDTLNELMKNASSSTNPMQVGTGVGVGAITTLYNQGSMQSTGHLLDLGIAGNGFVVLENGDDYLYTRAASLSFDDEGYLVHTASGRKVMGWSADSSGVIDTNKALGNLQAQQGQRIRPVASTGVDFTGNLDARLPNGATVQRDITAIDSLGNNHVYVLSFTRVDATHWDWQMTDEAGNVLADSTDPLLPGDTITFTNGAVSAGGTATVVINLGGTADPLNLALDFGAMEMVGGDSDVRGAQIGGVAAGTLQETVIDENGILSGVYSNGATHVLGQLAMATFKNQEGLLRVGSNMFAETIASGEVTHMTAGEGRARFNPRYLEMSNVDLSSEFVSMIVSQRAFQANSRIVTTTDEILQEVVNLKR